MWIVSWINKIFFFLIEAEFPKFHSYLNFQSFRGAWLVSCTSWRPLFQVYSHFSCGSVAIPAVQGITHSFNFFASSASLWAWCNPSHLISFDLHQFDPCRNSWNCPGRPGHPLSPTDPSPLLHPGKICWFSPSFSINFEPTCQNLLKSFSGEIWGIYFYSDRNKIVTAIAFLGNKCWMQDWWLNDLILLPYIKKS